MPGVSSSDIDIFVEEFTTGQLTPGELIDLGNGHIGLSYTYLEDIMRDTGCTDPVADVVIELVNAHGPMDDPREQLVIFPAGSAIAKQLAQDVLNGVVQMVQPHERTDLGGQASQGTVNSLMNATLQNLNAAAGSAFNQVGYDAAGNLVISTSGAGTTPGQRGAASTTGLIDLEKYVSKVPANIFPSGTVDVTDSAGNTVSLDFAGVIKVLNAFGDNDEQAAQDLMMEVAVDPNGVRFIQAINWVTSTAMAQYANQQGPVDPQVFGLLSAGEQEADGSVYLNEEMVAEHLTKSGKDPKAARAILQTLIRQGATDLFQDGQEVEIPADLAAKLAPALAKPGQEKAYGKRLPDGTAILTRPDYEAYLTAEGRDPEDADIELNNMVDYGAVWQGDRLLVPNDIVEQFMLPVPAVPSARRQARLAARQAGLAGQAQPNSSMAASVAELFGLEEDIAASRFQQVISHDFFDKEMFGDIVVESPAMAEAVTAGEGVLKTWPELTFDLWNLIYKVYPDIRTEKEIEPAYLANLYLINYAFQTEAFEDLREYTSGSLMDSILGYEVIILEVLQYIRKCMEEYEKQKQAAQKQFQQQMQEWLQNGGDPADPNAPQTPLNGQGIMMGQPGAQPMPGAMMAASNAMANAQQQAAQAAAQIEAINEMLQQAGAAPTPELAEAMADAQGEQQEAQAAMEDLEQQLNQAAQDLAGELRRAMEEIAGEALDQTTPIRKWIDGYGMGSGGEEGRPAGVRTNFRDAKRAIERIRHNKDFQKFADLLGRFRNIALAEVKKKSKKNGVAIKDVKVSNKVENALPGEYALLADPVMQQEFYRKYAEGQLLTYEKENTDAKGKGPMLVVMDMSGSMGGNKIMWAKALALALLEVAQKQRRDFAFIAFDDKIRHIYVFDKDKFDPNDMLDVAEIDASGGTEFQPALEIALEIISGTYKSKMLQAAAKKANLTSHKFKKADITFITDGDSWFQDIVMPPGKYVWNLDDAEYFKVAKSSKFLKKYHDLKDEKEFTCRAVLINVGGGASDRTVKLFSDSVMTLNNVSDLSEAKAAEIFAQVRGLDDDDELDADIADGGAFDDDD